MKKKILSLLLAVIMLFGMIPIGITTNAASTGTTTMEVDTWEELKSALTASGTATIKLMDDIKYKHYYKYHENNPEGLVFETITIQGTKTLDLNGYSIEVVDESNAAYDSYLGVYQSATTAGTLFEIPADSQLTINDEIGDGEITYKAYFNSIDYLRNEYEHVDRRDIFDIFGTLIVNGGKILAGDVKKKYVMAGLKDPSVRDADADPVQISAERYDGYARQQIWGTAVDVYSSGTLVVNGGELAGRGFGWTTGDGPNMDIGNTSRNAVVEISGGGTVLVNGGSFKANGGANVFAGGGVGSGLTVRAGYFKTDKHDNIICPGPNYVDNTRYYENGTTLVETGSYGNLGIPDSAWKDEAARMRILVDNAIYNGNAAGKVELNKTGGQTSGESLKVTIVPYLSYKKLPVTLNGGPYNNYIASDGSEIYWNANSTAPLTATVDYEPFYPDTTGLKNYKIEYSWRLYNSVADFEYETTTTSNIFDISEATDDAYFKGVTSVTCKIVEKADNLNTQNIMGTEAYSFKLNGTKTPLDKTSLPNSKMEVKVSYPEYSGLYSDIEISVSPTPSQLSSTSYGSSTVRYEYTYRDYSVGKNVTDSLNTHKYSLDWLDFGHVPISVAMIVYGSDGVARRFIEDTWALKLPDITLTGGTWNSDKTIFTGSPATAVNITVPLDKTNAQVDSYKVVKSDISGLYKITYDSNGNPVMSQIGVGNNTSYSVTSNGLYCYGAYDRNGNIVYSKPVKIEFSAEAYSINISKANTSPFVVYEDGTTSNDVLFTAVGGSSVTRTMIRWRIVGYPESAADYLSNTAIVNMKTSFTINISKFFKSGSDFKNVPPGKYSVQACVYKDGAYINVSNTIDIEVVRYSTYVDITNYTGIISGKTIEGPYVGEVMRLNCVPGNNASNPSFKSVTWKAESLLGTNVATISTDGLLTANKPGKVKVTATVTVASGENALVTNTQSVIINIPITEVEVTLGTPTIGGDPSKIASVPADAPYELVYHPEYSWVSGVHPDTNKFSANLIPKLSVDIAPKDGYVFPARQTYLADYSDDTWYTFADDIVVKVNGTEYNFRDFETTYTDGYTEYGKDYDGTFYEAQEIDFYWTWDRLKDPSHTYLDFVNLTLDIPEVDDVRSDDLALWEPTCTNNEAIYAFGSGMYKVSGDYLDDTDADNDNAVKMEDGEAFQKGQIYRMGIYFTTNNNYNYTTHFAEKVTLMVNGQLFTITTLQGGSNLDGSDTAMAYFYFVPTAPVSVMHQLWIYDLLTPVGYEMPPSADDINEFSTNCLIDDDDVYLSRLEWFFDANNNQVFDEGEDSPEYFNENGSFVAGLRYSVYLEAEARDRDGDGKGDYVMFEPGAQIYLDSQGNALMTGDYTGAVYKFPAATLPKKLVTSSPIKVDYVYSEEGYYPIQKEVDIITIGYDTLTVTFDDTIIGNAIYNETDSRLYMSTVRGLANGIYKTTVKFADEYGTVVYELPVTITVGQQAENVIKYDVTGDGEFDVRDLVRMKKILTNAAESSGASPDFNSDSSVNALDITEMRKALLKDF